MTLSPTNLVLYVYIILTYSSIVLLQEQCTKDECGTINSDADDLTTFENKYTKSANSPHVLYLEKINDGFSGYIPCTQKNCSCHFQTLKNDLKPFKSTGISKSMFDSVKSKGTKYQIISGKLYRQNDCHFPARCAGIEYFLLKIIKKLPDLEMVVNTRDWPQLNKKWGNAVAPVFSFSKTSDYWDIMYPAWSFWEGGPAIKLYPTGLGKWDQHRKSITNAAEKWPWEKKLNTAFFRGSRTSDERDPIVLLSRSDPNLVDAKYTKNQAWKSDADTLHAPPAEEVSLEDHCRYKYLFNYRGVAASFRFKHLFLCKSLVFHVGDEWLEFFYPSLIPWVHYIPVSQTANQHDINEMLKFFIKNDKISNEIAQRGFQHIWDHLRIADVTCYWKALLKKYAKLLNYKISKDTDLIEIKIIKH